MHKDDIDLKQDYLPRLEKELESAYSSYKAISTLRQKKVDQDFEQAKVYLNILVNQTDIKLNAKNLKRISRLLSSPEINNKERTYRYKQDKLEKRLLKIQEVLVSLISKRFKY